MQWLQVMRETGESWMALFLSKPLEEWGSGLLKGRKLGNFRFGKGKVKNMIWGLVSLECYLDIPMDMSGWQVDTKN